MTNNEIYQSILSGFTASINAMRLYPAGHPQAQGAVERCYTAMENAFRLDQELSILVMDDAVFIGDRPLAGAGPAGDSLIALMRRKGVDRLIFRKGLTKEQLTAFLYNLSSKDAVVYAQSHIQLGKIVLEPKSPNAGENAPSNPAGPNPQYHTASDLKTLYRGIYEHQTVSGTEVQIFAVDFVKTFNAATRPLGYLADIKSEDEYTYVHTINVALLTVSLAARLGLSGAAQTDIACAALMHDVGKMFVPTDILNKHGALNPGERAVMEMHPFRGAQYLGRMGGLPRLAMVVALEHHIKYDGSGYPRIDPMWKPHWVSQMVSIADIFDALRSRRPYRDALAQDKIFGILREDVGTVLNPELVNQFISMVAQ